MNEIIFNTGDKVCLRNGTHEYYHEVVCRIDKWGRCLNVADIKYGISIELYDHHGNVIGYETTDKYIPEVIKTKNIPNAIAFFREDSLVRFGDCENEDTDNEYR